VLHVVVRLPCADLAVPGLCHAGKYTIFGQVIDGMDVLDRMEKVPTGPNDRPLQVSWQGWQAVW
jgi:cyclophilin family peptidyl-prolyl cis-trans isomerase